MLPKYNTEDVISLVIAISLLASYVCFVRFLFNACRKAWSNMSKDKEAAINKEWRIPEEELLHNAWFGFCGAIAMCIKWHKVRKCEFRQTYCCRCCAGICIVVVAHVVYLVFALSLLHYWPATKHMILYLAEWSEELRSTLQF